MFQTAISRSFHKHLNALWVDPCNFRDFWLMARKHASSRVRRTPSKDTTTTFSTEEMKGKESFFFLPTQQQAAHETRHPSHRTNGINCSQ